MRLFIFALLLSGPAMAGALDDCQQATATSPDTGRCLQHRHAEVKHQLQTQEAKTQAAMRDLDQVTSGRFRAAQAQRQAQRAYQNYQQQQCRWVAASYASGNGADQARLACQIDLDEQRLAALRAQQ